MRELAIKVPPLLAEALGYDGAGRYVAVHYDRELGLRWSDGYTGSAADEEAWGIFCSWPAVADALGDNPFAGGEHALLLDRWERKAWLGDLVDVRLLLASQPSGLDALLAAEDLEPSRALEELLHEREVRRLELERRFGDLRAVLDAWMGEHY